MDKASILFVRPALVAVLALAPALSAQERRVDEARVNAAIRKGVESLSRRQGRAFGGWHSARELVLLAMVHAGVPPKDPVFDGLFREMLEDRPETTYRTALRAMVLEEVERVKYQLKIYECAQFLADNQCRNGQWSYGQPTSCPALTPSSRRSVATGPPVAAPGTLVVFTEPENRKPPVLQKIAVRKQRDGPPCGDNSNSQYAALGLRACHDAGIMFPREVVARAAEWWRQSQGGDGTAGGRVSTGGGPAAQGWGYRSKGEPSYGSMTAGAVGALVICDYILGTDWRRDRDVNAGVNWIRDFFSVSENPRRGRQP